MRLLRAAKQLLVRAGGQFLAQNSPQNAAAISYYVLFSLFPLMIFIIGAAGLLLGSESVVRREIIDWVAKEVPFSEDDGRNEVEKAVNGIEGPGGGAAGLAALVAMLWGASAMLGAIRLALNTAFGDEAVKRPFVPQKLIDLALVTALAVAFIAALAAGAALRFAANSTHPLGGVGDLADDSGLLWDLVSYVIPTMLAFAGFLALYCLVPSRLRSPARVWPGALLAAIALETASLLFSFYLENFSSYNVVFGALGAFAAFLAWVFLAVNIAIFGAEVAAEYPRLRAEPAAQPEMGGLSEPLNQRAWGLLRGLFFRGQPVNRAEARAERAASLHAEPGEPGQGDPAAPGRRSGA